MSHRPDVVEDAFAALRADTAELETMGPLRSVTSRRRRGLLQGAVVGGALVVVMAILGLLFLRDREGDDVVAGVPEPDAGQADDAAADGGAVIDVDSLAGSSWTLVEGHGPGGDVPIVAGWPITLSFDTESLGGTAACNGYGARYEIDDDTISLTELSWTEMACDGAVMDSEAAFLSALQDTGEIALLGRELIFSGPSSELRFGLDQPVPVGDLVGQLWLLDGLVQDDVTFGVLGDPATLLLNDDGTLAGGTGCRRLSGEYVISGSQILFTSFGADGDCPSQLRDQDDLVIAVLGDGFTAEVEATRLRLKSAGNEGLRYRAITEEELAEISGDEISGEPVPTDAELLVGTSWVLTAGAGPLGPVEMVPGSQPTMAFASSDTIEGNLSCNGFGADVVFDGPRVLITGIVQNDSACDPAVMASESAFTAALEDVAEFVIESGGELLILTGESTELLLELEGSEDPAGLGVSQLLDEQPTGTVVVVGAAIPTGGGWVLCDRADPGGFAGCGGRWITVTNMNVVGVDETGEGWWEGSLTDDGRFAIAGRDDGTTPTAEQRELADAYTNLPVDGTTVDTRELGLADTVLIGLGHELLVERTATQLTDLAAWELTLDDFRARVGPFSAAELLREGGDRGVLVEPSGGGLELVVGPHDHCASPPSPIHEQIRYQTQLSLQPSGIDSCLQWFAVDLFLDDDGEVVAIILDLFEP